MKFVDEINIKVRAGSGGDGHVSFLHSYLNPLSGPDGGNGGKGGNVYFRGSPHLNSLQSFSTRKNWFAPDGENGARGLKTGRNANDLYIDVPLGTVFYMTSEDNIKKPLAEIIEEKQLFLACEGAQGGRGNSAFANSVNRTPRYAQKGAQGRTLNLKLELIVIADVGLLGLPNAGKSTLLNALTSANSPSADYPFTTLSPQLGVITESRLKKKLVLADLPGIIAGATINKGLGLRFLKHVRRCKVLVLIIDSTSTEPFRDLQTLQEELKAAGGKLQGEQLVVWNKTDLLTGGDLKQMKQRAQKLGAVHSFFVSALKSINLENLVTVVDNITEDLGVSTSLLGGSFSHKNYDFTEDPVGLELRKLKNHYWKVSGPYIGEITQQTRSSQQQERISRALDLQSTRSFLLRNGVKGGDILLINNKEYFWS